MKEKILKNWGFKILALLLGFLLWFLVANIEDYSVTKTISGIPVEILNEQAIIEQGMVFEVEEGDTVDIKVTGRRSVVEGLTVEDFLATANMTELSITNSVQINVDVIKGSVRREIDIAVIGGTMKIAVEESGEKKLPITVTTTGNTQEGYAVVSKSATPNMVTISGAASKVKEVATVKVDVDVDGMNAGISTRGSLVLLNADGEVINTDKIKMNLSTVTVKVGIKKTKEVPVEITTVGDLAEGYGIAGDIEYQPTTVLIAGDESDLRNIRAIQIEDIDVSGLDTTYETTLELENYLPDGVVIADSSRNVAIKIKIEKLIEKTITIKSSDISISGKKDEYMYSLPEDDNEFEFQVVGLKADLDKLSVDDFEPTIDVTDIQRDGKFQIAIQMKELDRVQYSTALKATVTVIEKTEATEAEEEASSASTEE